MAGWGVIISSNYAHMGAGSLVAWNVHDRALPKHHSVSAARRFNTDGNRSFEKPRSQYSRLLVVI